ncbi:MAG: nitroreductase family protein [Chloroflexi bacterium]|nr:nitroreductase family protein [Chloroflexota bacterium]MQC26965.1 nitroreductase family protein [Chloroflexota bacterium]
MKGSIQITQAFLRSRRSVRRFDGRDVPEDILQRVVETATWAPNAHNRQVWRFIQLVKEKSRMALADGMGSEFMEALVAEGKSHAEAKAQVMRSRNRILEAPEAILLCMDTSVLDMYKDPARSRGEQLMGMQSVALAGGQLLLAAHAEGLGAVWVCSPLFAQSSVREALELPEAWEAQGLILLGYPAQEKAARPRKPLSDVLLRL